MSVRFTRVVLLYFTLGAVLFAGGGISFDQAGVAGFFIDQEDAGFVASDQADQNLGGIGGALQELVGTLIGGIQLVFNLSFGLFGFLNWPIVMLLSVNAPPMAVLLIGGPLSASFYLSIISLMKSSA